MKIFQCGHCHHPLFFENVKCEKCGHFSGYRDHDHLMLTFDPARPSLFSDRENIEYKYCKNKEHGVCNWVIENEDPNIYCRACQLNRIIPNLSSKKNFELWRNLEVAKHRLVYQLQKLGVPLTSKLTDDAGLCFDFVSRESNPHLMTGHLNGVITILLREADSVIREQTRKHLLEPYRTLIGHLRHEVGHHYWEQLVSPNATILAEFRDTFGDERADYSSALEKHYRDGAPADWEESFITRYAASHPWEDWAETWAHYLHVMDMVETAHFFGLKVHPLENMENTETDVTFDSYAEKDFDKIVQTCVPLSFAVNSINRAMGVPDVYPFVINSGVVNKMKFIHQLLNSSNF